ncbi:hypothetical protein PACTADRAFT_51397 [Pachysolen tannophilus NRRL Y-2460]|uniref:General transcription and DNA repair factor IIH n=1 Tax=Pachysolen tannophilus NRRL Y-2460 TaxID=669874 RepID=A0A1E4TPE9_PACTA|nr:hypothetical protein PACTADRAFT_51397 [Pachysolen tannophilus NRRL Y-2460]
MDESDDEYIGELSSPVKNSNHDSRPGISNRTRRKTGGGDSSQNRKLAAGNGGGYSWEDDYQRSWDIVKEDEAGSLETIVSGLVEARKKRYLKNVTPFQRGIIRTLILVLDFSAVMAEKDLRPNRASLTILYAIEFVNEYFDQNPISQLGIVIMRNGLATLVSEVSGNPNDHIEALKSMRRLEPQGDPTLQNVLEMARGLLMHVASHSTREVLIIFGALLTSDPGDVHKTIQSLVKEKIRVRIIGLTAQVAICKEICKKTNFGDESSYGIILNEAHFKELLMEAVTPVAITKSISQQTKGFTLVKMGFPSRVSENSPTFCSCHSKLVYGGYICPNCSSKICSLPAICPCCNMMLILSTHLARSYHHLFPLKLFNELPKSEQYDAYNCFGCQTEFPEAVPSGNSVSIGNVTTNGNKSKKELITSSRYRCPNCHNDFCIDCDVFIHEILHNCPGCESNNIKTNLIQAKTSDLHATHPENNNITTATG